MAFSSLRAMRRLLLDLVKLVILSSGILANLSSKRILLLRRKKLRLLNLKCSIMHCLIKRHEWKSYP